MIPRLQMHSISKRFGATIALDQVSLSVNSGEVLALVGENGAGKSTLMKILSGAIRADAGEMTLDGAEYLPRDPLHARRSGVAMIYQELSLAPHLSVMENILLGIEPTKFGLVDWRTMRTKAREALAQLGREEIAPQRIVGTLSIAEQQLVEIARAVATGCRVLVLDEPTSSLTHADIQHLFALVRALKAKGHAIVYISHFLEEVREISDRFEVLRDGSNAGGDVTWGTRNDKIVSLMVGRSVKELYPRSARRVGEMVLDVESLSGHVKPFKASLKLRRGEVLGIAGLIGSGRTELLRTLFGLDPIRSGKISLATWSGAATPARRWSQRCGFASEDRKTEGLALGLSVSENVTLSRMPAMLSSGKLARDSRAWIDKLSVKCRSASQPAGDLSGGNQQKVALARLLHHDVDVLLLDEPTRGIDVGSKAQIYQLIDELACSGRAVLMISSYLPELLGVCDRIAVMCRGTLGNAKPVVEWTEESIMKEATGDAGEKQ